MHGWPSGVVAGSIGASAQFSFSYRFFLPALGRDVLVEVALRVHEADADERHAEVARLLAVVAGEHAQPAGVDRQRLVQGELGGEVRDRLRPTSGNVRAHHVSARAARGVELGERVVVRRQEVGIGRRRARASPAGPSAASAPDCARSRARAGSRAVRKTSRALLFQLHQRSSASSRRRLIRSGSGGNPRNVP